jgi:ligand-binding sensor domain-containing protein
VIGADSTTAPLLLGFPIHEKQSGFYLDSTQISQYIRRIFQDQEGVLWFGTVGHGVLRYDGKTLHAFNTNVGFGGNSVQDIVQDKAGHIWMGTSGGVTEFNPYAAPQTTNICFTNYTESSGLSSQHIMSLYLDKNETLWAGTSEGLCYCDLNARANAQQALKFTLLKIPTVNAVVVVRNMTQDDHGNLWLATENQGVLCYTGGSFKHYTAADGLGSDKTQCVIQDKNGAIWIGATGGGLIYHNPMRQVTPNGKPFSRYSEEKGSNEVGKLYLDKAGNLWVAVRGGVRRYSADIVFSRNNMLQPGIGYTNFYTAEGLSNCCVQSIFEDRSGNVWFGSGAGLFRLDKDWMSRPCLMGTCSHNISQPEDSLAHFSKLANTVINVTKTTHWPIRFR